MKLLTNCWLIALLENLNPSWHCTKVVEEETSYKLDLLGGFAVKIIWHNDDFIVKA